MATATLTSKGQITIPLPVRDRLGLKAGDRIDFIFQADGTVSLQPRRLPFERLRGMLRTAGRRPLSVRDMDRAISRGVVERWKRSAARRRRK